LMTLPCWNYTIPNEKTVAQVISDKIGCSLAVIYTDSSCEIHSLWKEVSPLALSQVSFLAFVHNNFFFGLEDESTSSVVISFSASPAAHTEVNAWASDSFLPLDVEVGGLSQLASAGVDLAGIKSNNTLPFKCNLMSSSGHLLAVATANPQCIFVLGVKRHRSMLWVRVQQTVTLSSPPLCIAITPTHFLAAVQDNNEIRVWELKPVEPPAKPNERTPIKKTPLSGQQQLASNSNNNNNNSSAGAARKEKEMVLQVEQSISTLNCVTPNCLFGTASTGEAYVISLSLLNNPNIPSDKAVPVVMSVDIPFKVLNYTLLPPAPRLDQAGSFGTLICVNAHQRYTVHLLPLDPLVKLALAKEESLLEEGTPPTQKTPLLPKQSMLFTAPVTHLCFVPFDSLVVVCEHKTLQVYLL